MERLRQNINKVYKHAINDSFDSDGSKGHISQPHFNVDIGETR